MDWWLLLTVLGIAAIVVVGVRTGRHQGSTTPMHGYANDRLGVRDPRDTPWGPSGGI